MPNTSSMAAPLDSYRVRDPSTPLDFSGTHLRSVERILLPLMAFPFFSLLLKLVHQQDISLCLSHYDPRSLLRISWNLKPDEEMVAISSSRKVFNLFVSTL